MNREAVALGTPVWTTFEGRLGAVDERLIAEGRLRRIARPRGRRAGAPRRRGAPAERIRRDPQLLVDLLLQPARASRAGLNCPACADVSARRSRSTGTP